jgi:hypothetical protein
MPGPWTLRAACRDRESPPAVGRWPGCGIGHQEGTWPWEGRPEQVEASGLALLRVEVRLMVVARRAADLPELAPLQMAQGHTGCRQQPPYVEPPHRRWTAVGPCQLGEGRAVLQQVAGYIAVPPEPEHTG